ncbi:MAG: YchJ family metal-binding protein [Flaviflexus sp.]|nr:YchJ family metal-binding protein [Flaviflexus sp.]
MTSLPNSCPCGGADYHRCCEPLHDGAREAATAVELMRGRYSAYAKGRFDYVYRTWHPRTRPRSIDADHLTWHQLAITDSVAGGPDEDFGTVEFTASYRDGGRSGNLHERSRFMRRAGRWCYLDAEG